MRPGVIREPVFRLMADTLTCSNREWQGPGNGVVWAVPTSRWGTMDQVPME